MRQLGIGWVLGVGAALAACSKTESASAPAASASAPTAGAPAVAAASTAAPSAAESGVAAAPPPAPPPSGAPASFKGGSKENIAGAVGLGCEATSLDGYLQLLCRKNGTGGHPVRAIVRDLNAPAPAPSGQEPGSEPAEGQAAAANETGTNEQGELSIVVPFSGETKQDIEIEWTDTRYTLHVTGNKATFEWAASGIPHRRACQQLLDENKTVVSAAQKAEGSARLTTTEATKFARFGVCQNGGLGSWAVSLKALSGIGEGNERRHRLELEVVRIDIEGARKSAPFASLEVAPGGFELSALQVYDYDDDGRDELIVPYEVKATHGATPALPPAIWSFSDAGVAAYTKAPSVNGGIGVEQLDFDMRPDFATFMGYVAYLGADCGLASCPPRLTGPKLFLHSLPDGSFTDKDEAVRSALKRASCQSKPAAVVVEAAGVLNAQQTAKNLVCSRAWGVAAEAVLAELASKHAALCGEAPSCPIESTLQAWAKLELPIEPLAPKK
jgi:hypothetical protein